MSMESRMRRRAGAARTGLVAVIGLVGLLAAPGTAVAQSGVVTPLFECVTKLHGAAGWTALMGYSNSSNAPVTWAVGPENVLRPSARNGEQPTTFQPGVHRGVFTVAFTTGNSVSWTVGGSSVVATMNAKRCPASTELPAEGNGTGPAIVLVGAGVIGAVALHRARRRPLPTTVRTEGGRDDA
ncbi:hypothetical protein [Modestobacter excelsi]|uniref:hypothetical protein n=1 Tax=Modestobacter excelsi TaxID=2213161 RepID=UPI00110CBBDC|nr:hypothetical protein [Modestobacter excelsi]